MSNIKLMSLGGLNENGKNIYTINIDGNILVFDPKFDSYTFLKM